MEFDELFAPDCVVSQDGKLEAVGQRRRSEEGPISHKHRTAAGNQVEPAVQLNSEGEDERGGRSLAATDGSLDATEFQKPPGCSQLGADTHSSQLLKSHDHEDKTGRPESSMLRDSEPPRASKSATISHTGRPRLRVVKQQGGSTGLRVAMTGLSSPLSPPQLGKGLQPGRATDLRGPTTSLPRPSLSKVIWRSPKAMSPIAIVTCICMGSLSGFDVVLLLQLHTMSS